MGILQKYTEETPPAPQQQPVLLTEENFKLMYSRIKIIFLMKDGSILEHYGWEANLSLEQMMAGAPEVLLDARQGHADCLAQEERERHNYVAAALYRRRADRWSVVAQFAFGKQELNVPLDFSNSTTRCETLVKDHFFHLRRLRAAFV